MTERRHQEKSSKKQDEASPDTGEASQDQKAAMMPGTADSPAKGDDSQSKISKASEESSPQGTGTTDAAAKAKAAAAAKQKAAAARRPVRRKKKEEPLEPSPKQPWLDQLVKQIDTAFGKNTVEASYINRPNEHLPSLVIKKERWREVARFLHEEENLAFDYLQNLSGVDYEEHMEAVYHLYSLNKRHPLCVRVKTERENPQIPSVSEIWSGANWNEREAFDLLGIHFTDHPDLRRILMSDDWVGYPLRKDYEPYDGEV